MWHIEHPSILFGATLLLTVFFLLQQLQTLLVEGFSKMFQPQVQALH